MKNGGHVTSIVFRPTPALAAQRHLVGGRGLDPASRSDRLVLHQPPPVDQKFDVERPPIEVAYPPVLPPKEKDVELPKVIEDKPEA